MVPFLLMRKLRCRGVRSGPGWLSGRTRTATGTSQEPFLEEGALLCDLMLRHGLQRKEVSQAERRFRAAVNLLVILPDPG